MVACRVWRLVFVVWFAGLLALVGFGVCVDDLWCGCGLGSCYFRGGVLLFGLGFVFWGLIWVCLLDV